MTASDTPQPVPIKPMREGEAAKDDGTRLASGAYYTRLASAADVAVNDQTRLANTGDAAILDQTRLATEAYQSRPATAADKAAETGDRFKIGDVIDDRYEVLAIHRGSIGVVYGCFDRRDQLPQAIKTLQQRFVLQQRFERRNEMLELFKEEAMLWMLLEKHPFIVQATWVGEWPNPQDRFNPIPYIVTDYIRGDEGMGSDLRSWLGRERLTLPVAVEMALQIAQGMQHAVRKIPSLVHRDLKPANILVNNQGRPMVTDFGLVAAAQTDAGTPAYMAPEQWLRQALDTRTDLYAFGCILYEMCTAHRMFPAMSETDWQTAHLR